MRCPQCGRPMKNAGFVYVAKTRRYKPAYDCNHCQLRKLGKRSFSQDDIKEPPFSVNETYAKGETMSEGEFKKRLREMVDSGQIIYNEDKIFGGWIDEAYKEYPLESNPKYRIEFRTEEEKRYYAKIGCTHEGINRTLLDNDRDAWFLKWWGNK